MKRFMAVWTVLSSLSMGAHAADTANLTVKLTGVSDKGGVLMIAVIDKTGLPPRTKPLASRKVPAVAGDMTVTFEGLPTGETGVKVLHDVNNNGVMDKRLGLFPAEPYGFSNNPTLMGPPSFDVVKFHVKPGDNVITIRMN